MISPSEFKQYKTRVLEINLKTESPRLLSDLLGEIQSIYSRVCFGLGEYKDYVREQKERYQAGGFGSLRPAQAKERSHFDARKEFKGITINDIESLKDSLFSLKTSIKSRIDTLRSEA